MRKSPGAVSWPWATSNEPPMRALMNRARRKDFIGIFSAAREKSVVNFNGSRKSGRLAAGVELRQTIWGSPYGEPRKAGNIGSQSALKKAPTLAEECKVLFEPETVPQSIGL